MWVPIPRGSYMSRFVTTVWVEWRPQDTALHYTDLYAGIYESLRKAPVSGMEAQAREYLTALLRNTITPPHSPAARLQRDRIAWVRAWLRELQVRNVKLQNIG